jgi:hypothetical protein
VLEKCGSNDRALEYDDPALPNPSTAKIRKKNFSWTSCTGKEMQSTKNKNSMISFAQTTYSR